MAMIGKQFKQLRRKQSLDTRNSLEKAYQNLKVINLSHRAMTLTILALVIASLDT